MPLAALETTHATNLPDNPRLQLEPTITPLPFDSSVPLDGNSFSLIGEQTIAVTSPDTGNPVQKVGEVLSLTPSGTWVSSAELKLDLATFNYPATPEGTSGIAGD